MGDHDALLERFKPVLLYDSQEAFFADHPAQMAVNPGNQLRRRDGTVLARADDHTLSLHALTSSGYPGHVPLAVGDRLSIHGRDYRRQYVRLRRAHPELKNHLVARARRDRDGALWLQYWCWYFFNDYHLAANFGLHEGDWEMIQLLMDGDDPVAASPLLAVYAQHRRAERRPWEDVGKDPRRPDAPLVFVARGSHASYFEPGTWKTEAWFDIADGTRRSPLSTLLFAADEPTDWAGWPGRWGDTEPRIPGLEDPSPDSPCRHPQWRDPRTLSDTAAQRRAPRTPKPGPDFEIARSHGRLLVHYDLSRLATPATTVVVNVNSHAEHDMPPRTFTFDVQRQVVGTILTTIAVDPDNAYEIHLSVSLAGGEPTSAVCRILDPGDHRPVHTILSEIGALMAPAEEWLREHFRRRDGAPAGP